MLASSSNAATVVEVFVGVGSNLDRERNIVAGVAALRDAFGELRESSVIDNPAVGFVGDDFLNLVVGFETADAVQVVADRLRAIEQSFGRMRGDDRYVARALDLDLLLYGDLVDENLRIPRADILEYDFVLGPLAEIAPDHRHPVTGESYAALWKVFTASR